MKIDPAAVSTQPVEGGANTVVGRGRPAGSHTGGHVERGGGALVLGVFCGAGRPVGRESSQREKTSD